MTTEDEFFLRRKRRPVIIYVGALVVLAIACVLFGTKKAFDAFHSGQQELVEVTGDEAFPQMEDLWPEDVEPAAVKSVNLKSEWTRDSYSMWYRIQLSPISAALWQDDLHFQIRHGPEDPAKEFAHLEGVRFHIQGRPPLHRQTGTTPAWWSPPPLIYRATNLMCWKPSANTGAGMAVYSAFDPKTNTLWAYECFAQDDLLWQHDKMPSSKEYTPVEILPHSAVDPAVELFAPAR